MAVPTRFSSDLKVARLTRLESNHCAKRKQISFVFKSLHKKEGGGV
jgi:hypothetical protein